MTLDSDVLQTPGSDLRLIVYSAAPGTPDASRLQLLAVVGRENLRPLNWLRYRGQSCCSPAQDRDEPSSAATTGRRSQDDRGGALSPHCRPPVLRAPRPVR